MKYKELSANTVALISCRRRLTKVLAGAARGEKGSKSGGDQVRLSDVNTERMSRLKQQRIYKVRLLQNNRGSERI